MVYYRSSHCRWGIGFFPEDIERTGRRLTLSCLRFLGGGELVASGPPFDFISD
jgi:hypothetical protein